MNAPANNSLQTDDQRLRSIIELITTSLEHRSFQAAALAVLGKLATSLGCNSASFGIVHDQCCKVLAVSHSAAPTEKMNLTRAAGAAMDEALDQDTTVVFPALPGRPNQVLRAHTEFARHARAGAICTLPVNHDGQLVGAILLEHPSADAFDAATLSLCECITSLVGPLLHGKFLEERSLSQRFIDKAQEALMNIIGPQHMALKLGGIVATVIVLLLTFVTGDYRVTASARLEGMVQRVVIAPMDGFIMEADVRAGDLVKEGDLLCLLDDKELQLDRTHWFSEKQKIAKAYRRALGEQDRAEVVILKAKLDQATVKLELSEENLARSRITAPLSGVIVAGDLSQSLGAPVERGDVLFEVTPLDGYRVMLQVDERDIGQLAEQQSGTLALTGYPHERFTFVVTRITPVSSAEDGSNFFMVEAELENTGTLLRPGMQGIGKIEIGKRQVGWILTHELTDWLRLWLWV
jgi:RND family efflux transporter MFP subunit